ncbi:MAG: hypothetical protein ABI612_07225 [Betaproteobacteria bacterium]
MRLFRYALGMLLSMAISAHAAVVGFGSLTDTLEGSNPDLASASVSIDSGGSVTFSVDFGPSTSLTEASPFFVIDIDQNPATGFAGVTSTHLDSDLIGAEYVLRFNASAFGGDAVLSHISQKSFAVTRSGSTLSTSLNLSDLGGDDGLMNFKVVASRQLSAASWTGIQDYMSEPGQAVGRVIAVPEADTWAAVSVGLLSMLSLRRRRRAIQQTGEVRAADEAYSPPEFPPHTAVVRVR